MAWTATRNAALEQLHAFLPRAGGHYARNRNFDEGRAVPGPSGRSHVSGLSPWLRRRQLLEQEVVRAAHQRHGARDAEKFVQEILWRTYWKGWLELHPSVWDDWLQSVQADRERLRSDGHACRRYQRACEGRSGIRAFDTWVAELTEHGYLHNHARMWFASIWIFTLGLPWSLGAAFFLQHLLDGDAASNTLSWRWVAGLQTKGKHYLAKAANIAKFTPEGFEVGARLNESAPARSEHVDHPAYACVNYPSSPPVSSGRSGLLVTTEDLMLEHSELAGHQFASIAVGKPAELRDGGWLSAKVQEFDDAALKDGQARGHTHFGAPVSALDPRQGWHRAVIRWASEHRLDRIVAMAPHVGWWQPGFERLSTALEAKPEESPELVLVRRRWDSELFAHATRGYFRFKRAAQNAVGQLIAG